LNENGTLTSRPSNSGMATCIAASIGVSAADESSHAARDEVRHSPCTTGMSSPARASTDQTSSSPPAAASAGRVPPAASTVTTRASHRPSSPVSPSSTARSEAVKTGSGFAPAVSTAAQSVSTNPVLPDSACAR
jgi:hypothetical protein